MGEVIPLRPKPSGKPYKQASGSPLEVLRRARVTLAPRDAWAKGATTRTAKVAGEPVHQRCLIQTLRDVDGVHVKTAETLCLSAIKELYPSRPSTSIPGFNDHSATIKHDVLRVLDRAIEKAEKGEK